MLKKMAYGCACAAAILSVASATAAPLGNGVRLPATLQPLLGVAGNGGLSLPLLGTDLPLLSTSLVSPLLAGPLGSSPSLPNQLLVPALAIGSPVVFTALPGLDGAAGQGLGPGLDVVTPVIDGAMGNLTATISEVNGPGPGAPPGAGGGN